MIRHFLRDTRGAAAPLLALTILPVTASVRLAIDFSRANSVKADLQAALDSTALMLSKEVATDTSAQLHAHALAYFKAVFNRPGINNISISASYTNSGTIFVVPKGGDGPEL